ncbi:MAG TPA: L-aspartate oxidase, partial [Paludibacter sp.]|nr:L-aspartate oxidase [Paludibacter sp.]
MTRQFDFLVIGSGIAGISFALKASRHGTVALLSKSSLDDTNTSYAQGGIAAVTYSPDSFEKHIADTIVAGDGHCDVAVVEKVITEAPQQIEELLNWGIDFDRDGDGKFDLHREGGHSEHRILHHKDNTGYEIQEALIRKLRTIPNIEIFENTFAIEIITQHHMGEVVTMHTPNIECYGAYVLDQRTNHIHTYLSKVTLLATGGIGGVYATTTNPDVATGDGIAMVHRARGVIKDMEFVQFHPTAFYNPGERPTFLITEAIRGYGAILRGQDGREFMQKYDDRGSLAPRDIVARAIDNEMKIKGHDFVYLDVTHKDAEETKDHFPNIYKKCLEHGIDITKDFIPVSPTQHYVCGGIVVDMNARTSINRLYAAGECSCTGLHGANRLASNSLIEAIVYADVAAKDAAKHIRDYSWNTQIPAWDDEGTKLPEEMVLITQSFREVEQIMSSYVGIVRSNLRLQRAMRRLEILFKETEDLFDRS